MQSIIKKLIVNSLQGNFYSKVDKIHIVNNKQKAISCMEALRKGCISEDEAVAFNDFLFDIKTEFSVGKHEGFWKIVYIFKTKYYLR